MTINKQDLGRLVNLQAQDKLLDSIQGAIAKVPQDIVGLRSRFDGVKASLSQVKDEVTKVQLKRKEKEIELGQKEEAIRKHSQELNQVKTNEAFKALQSEIDKAKAEVSDLETEILTLMEETDRLAKDEKARNVELKAIEAKTNEEIRALEGHKTELESKHAACRAQREALAAQIPQELLEEYEQIRKRRQGVAVARVDGKICSICHITLRPQLLVNLAKGTSLITCESCQRILYSGAAPEALKA